MIIELVERIHNKDFDEKQLNQIIDKYKKKSLFQKQPQVEILNESLANKLQGYEMMSEDDLEVEEIMRNIEMEQE